MVIRTHLVRDFADLFENMVTSFPILRCKKKKSMGKRAPTTLEAAAVSLCLKDRDLPLLCLKHGDSLRFEHGSIKVIRYSH